MEPVEEQSIIGFSYIDLKYFDILNIYKKKLLNKGSSALRPAEGVEGRGLAKGNPDQQTRFRTQGRADLQHALVRIRQAARKERKLRFTALWHHVYEVGRLREAYYSLKRKATPGVDGQTWQHYGEKLGDNLAALSDRLRRGAYRARPVKRVYIPKPDGRQRPIGITTLEDKIVQQAVLWVLQSVYEQDFLGFSYGFRPGRRAHDAVLKAQSYVQFGKRIVVDVDLEKFFDRVNHDILIDRIGKRINDQAIVSLIRAYLNTGIMDHGVVQERYQGTPQGGPLSPLLANILLDEVDKELEKIDHTDLLGKIAVANSKIAYAEYKKIIQQPRWQQLAAQGAQVQRVLWASTSTKNPAYPDNLYVDELIGPDTVNTLPPATLDSFLDHGRVAKTLTRGLEEAQGQVAQLADLGIDLDAITQKLQNDGVVAFAKPFAKLLESIAEKCRQLKAA